MDIEREMMVQVVVSVSIVLLFILVIVGLGSAFSTDGFSQQGALAIIGAIVGFVVVILGVGYVVNR